MTLRHYLGLVAVAVLAVGALYWWTFSRIPGVKVSSWWRAPWKNANVGGNPFSLHQLGLAWDVIPGTATTQAQLIATGLPMKIVPEGDHIHVQLI